MGSAVIIGNWQDMQLPMQSSLENGVYAANNQIWMNQQANANQWAAQAKANDDAWRTTHAEDVAKWEAEQSAWRSSWTIAQAAYAAAQVLLANNALEAAKDAADKQYEIADRQQVIAEQEYARYSAHFAPCENTTIDEECARPEYAEDIEAQANQAVVDVRRQFTIARQQLQRRRHRYCIGPLLAQERELAIEEARVISEAKEKVRRYLEERQENRRDKYFNRKLQLFNIGRGIKADAVGELARSAQGIAAGTDIELAARNQFYGAILSSFGGLLGSFLPRSPQAPTGFGRTGGPMIGAPNLFSISAPATQQGIGRASEVA